MVSNRVNIGNAGDSNMSESNAHAKHGSVRKDNEEKMNRKTVEMYDLMLKTGTKVKAYSRQDEDKLKAKIKLKKLGLNSISELD